MSVFDIVEDKAREQVAFLFDDTGDKIFRIDGIGLSSLTFDVIESEGHRMANDVSDYPVEGRENITDNILQRPAELTITAFISNTPINGLIDQVAHFADRFLNGRKRTQEAFNQLLQLRDKRLPVTVATRYRVYEDMGITGVNIVRQPEDGESLTVDITFKHINIVKQQTGNVPPGLGSVGKQSGNATKTRAQTKVDAGKSTGSNVEVKTAGKDRSILATGKGTAVERIVQKAADVFR